MLEMMWRKGDFLHCWWKYKLMRPLWKIVWRFLKELKIELPYDWGILFKSICLEKIKTLFHYYCICYSDLWSFIFDVNIAIIWRGAQPCQYKMVNLIDTCCVCTDHPHWLASPPSLSLPIPWDTTILKLGQLITPQWFLSIQVKARVIHLPL